MSRDYTKTQNPRSLTYANSVRPFPEWASGSADVAEACVKMASVAFADTAGRLLPIYDKKSTFLSAVDYFANATEHDESVGERIKQACIAHGVGEELEPYAELFAGHLEKSAAEVPATVAYAIDTEINGQAVRLLPLVDADDVRQAGRQLMKMAAERRVTFDIVHEASETIYKAAADMDLLDKLPAKLVQLSQSRIVDYDKALSRVADREKMASADVPFSVYTGAIEDARDGRISDDEAIEKIAAADYVIGVPYHYERRNGCYTPKEVIECGAAYEDIVKEASAVVLLRGVPVPSAVIENLPSTEVEYTLSKSASDDWSSLRDSPAELSVAAEAWNEADQKAILSLAVKHG